MFAFAFVVDFLAGGVCAVGVGGGEEVGRTGAEPADASEETRRLGELIMKALRASSMREAGPELARAALMSSIGKALPRKIVG